MRSNSVLTQITLTVLLSAGAAWGQCQAIDEFSSGKDLSINKVPSGEKQDLQKDASAAGGFRHVFLGAGSPLRRSATVGFVDGLLLLESGVDVGHGLQLFYGIDQKGNLAPLGLDLSGCSAFDVDFHSLDGVLNFNIVLFTAAGALQAAENLEPPGVNTAPFTASFPLSSFTNNTEARPAVAADFQSVDAVSISTQSGLIAGNYSLDAIAVSP